MALFFYAQRPRNHLNVLKLLFEVSSDKMRWKQTSLATEEEQRDLQIKEEGGGGTNYESNTETGF